MSLSGQCLCGRISFELAAAPAKFYRCHCSLCRRQSGTGHNVATIVRASDFRWRRGAGEVASWRQPSGFRNDFCPGCGCTVPNPLRDLPYVWVPVGLLEDDLDIACIGDFFVADARRWDSTRSADCHDGFPGTLEDVLSALEVGT